MDIKIKDKELSKQIKKNPPSKEEFEELLKKACNPKPCSEPSET
jgi:hypothetical protein